MILALNLLVAAIAQKATWSLRFFFLKIFLFYLMIFDVIGCFSYVYTSARWYWYTYWVFRTVSFALQGLLATEIAVRAKLKLPTFSYVWGSCVLLLLLLVDLKFWFFNPTFEKTSFEFSIGSASLIGITLVLAFFLKPTSFRVWLGSATWVSITILSSILSGKHIAYYPLASLVPLAIWSSCLIRRRGPLTIPQQKKDGYVTTERDRGRGSQLQTGQSRDVTAVLQGTTGPA